MSEDYSHLLDNPRIQARNLRINGVTSRGRSQTGRGLKERVPNGRGIKGRGLKGTRSFLRERQCVCLRRIRARYRPAGRFHRTPGNSVIQQKPETQTPEASCRRSAGGPNTARTTAWIRTRDWISTRDWIRTRDWVRTGLCVREHAAEPDGSGPVRRVPVKLTL